MAHYDPWSHAIQIFVTRWAQFILLSAGIGGVIWYCLLSQYFHAALLENSRLAFTGEHRALRAILLLCLSNGALLTSCLFVWLMRGRHLQRGERHHRGARIHDNDYA